MPWPRGKRYASINNFGFGGSNAHVILEKAPLRRRGAKQTDPLTRKIYAVSGHDKRAVVAEVRALGVYLEKNPVVFEAKLMDNLAYTLGQRRTFFPWRLGIPASSHTELIDSLSVEPEIFHSHNAPTIGYVFTGQGAQWYAMGKELVAAYPMFQQTMETVDEVLKGLGARFSIIGTVHMITTSRSNKLMAFNGRRVTLQRRHHDCHIKGSYGSTSLHSCSNCVG